MHKSFINKGEDSIPNPGDIEKAKLGWAHWKDALSNLSGQGLKIPPKGFDKKWPYKPLLDSVFANSPYLTQSIISDPLFVFRLFRMGPDRTFRWSLAELQKKKKSVTTAELLSILRIAKKQISLTAAIADISGVWALNKVMERLSYFAEIAVSIATQHSLLELASAGAFHLPYPNHPEQDSGLIVLAMGKLGAKELNYSSDIDLIILFDPMRITTDQPALLQTNFVRLARLIVKLLDERTEDGYVFRTDLRLRPDPGSTPLAITVQGAEFYYEGLGQNWERAALIKSRPIAGDVIAGNEFLKKLLPFIWRKHLDFAAIQDIHSIKRQIHSYKVNMTKGHDIKIGRGGIREIEFFTQTQQLIWGGRIQSLQIRSTLKTLKHLAQKKKIPEKTERELSAAYKFLRFIEHRLQMINDEQTHLVPTNKEHYERFAAFAGFPNTESFHKELLRHIDNVQHHYDSLFEAAPRLSLSGVSPGSLVFTGSNIDTETLKTLSDLGFQSPKTVDQIIRAWHHGRIKATRSARAREILTELIPVLLKTISNQPNPDSTFVNFNAFVEQLPFGVQVFAMFQSNPNLLQLICEIIGTAPRLAKHLSKNPTILDAFLDEDFLAPLPSLRTLTRELASQTNTTDFIEEKFDIARRWNSDRRFQIGVQLLNGLTSSKTAQKHLTNVAEAALQVLSNCVEREFSKQYGNINNSSFALLAVGKLGSRELTWNSDLDLIFIYDHPKECSSSDGEKSLAPSQYFGRLCKRLINSVEALTTEGRLYQIDMRLRPYGNKGPIAVSLEAFKKYYINHSWTWEKMALTRARIILGKPSLKKAISDEVTAFLQTPIKVPKLLQDVHDMRQRIERNRPPKDSWSLKYIPGGRTDLDFIIQYLILKHAPNNHPLIMADTQVRIKKFLEFGLVNREQASALGKADELWSSLQTVISLATDDEQFSTFSTKLKNILATSNKMEDFAALENYKHEIAKNISNIYKRLIAALAESVDKE